MTRLSMACAVLAMVGATQAPALAAPLQIDFNVANFGPVPGQSDSFTKTAVVEDIDLTFMALDDQLQSAGLLYWDANDGNGFRDGFGIMGSDSGYAGDEIEANERLGLKFSRAVNLYGFNLTDFFNESEPSLGDCNPGNPSPACYIERGSFLVQFGDGTQSNWLEFNASSDAPRSTNGLFDMAVDYQNVVGLLFRAPGQSTFGEGFDKLEDFSLAGVRIEATPVPEPGTLMLMGLGLSGLAAARRRRRRA